MTTSGAHIPQNKKGGRPIIPTFPNIRTSGLFANRMKAMGIHQLTDFLVMGACLEMYFKPGREGFFADGAFGRRNGSDF